MNARSVAAVERVPGELFRTPHLIVARVPAEPFVRIVRTSEPLRSAHDFDLLFALLDRHVPRSVRGALGLLTDFRAVPLRNDPEFERVLVPRMLKVTEGFVRSAVLVRTAVGKLQIARQTHGRSTLAMRTFDDERAALAYLTG